MIVLQSALEVLVLKNKFIIGYFAPILVEKRVSLKTGFIPLPSPMFSGTAVNKLSDGLSLARHNQSEV